ncbi:MAG: hypothetical protein OQK93_00390 [Gammaproteobacteria bacterium]|jgi:hypothetical protein|nr:hypothetical protein [Gammaproteobacteria bacterium]
MKRTIITLILASTFTAFAIHAVEQKAFSGAGIIESTTGGFMFPDGTVQTSAAYGEGFAEALAELSKVTNYPTPAVDASIDALEPLGCGNGPAVSIAGIGFFGQVTGMWGYEAISELFDFLEITDGSCQFTVLNVQC